MIFSHLAHNSFPLGIWSEFTIISYLYKINHFLPHSVLRFLSIMRKNRLRNALKLICRIINKIHESARLSQKKPQFAPFPGQNCNIVTKNDPTSSAGPITFSSKLSFSFGLKKTPPECPSSACFRAKRLLSGCIQYGQAVSFVLFSFLTEISPRGFHTHSAANTSISLCPLAAYAFAVHSSRFARQIRKSTTIHIFL